MSLAYLFSRLAIAGMTPAMQKVAAYSCATIAPIAAVAAFVALMCGTYSASTIRNSVASEKLSGAIQPPGSFLVQDIDKQAAATVAAAYRRLGGKHVRRFFLPMEDRRQVRASSPAYIACVRAMARPRLSTVPATCLPTGTRAPLNTVLLSDDATVSAADPALRTSGRVGIVVLKTGTDRIVAQRAVAAESDEALGGNLSGLVVPTGSSDARGLALKKSSAQLLALLDFAALGPGEQARIRSLVARVAPTAQVSDSSQRSSFELERSIAAAAGLFGAGMVCFIVLIGGYAVYLRQLRISATIGQLGAPLELRRRAAVRLVAGPLATMMLTVPVTWLTARSISIQFDSGLGSAWLAPVSVGMLAFVGLGLFLYYLPSRADS